MTLVGIYAAGTFSWDTSTLLIFGLCSSGSAMLGAQFFGLYALSGTVTAFLAPLIVATFTDWFDSQQIGFASLSILLLIGGVLLTRVKEEQGTAASQ